MVRVVVDSEIIPETLHVKQEYTLAGMQSHYKAQYTQTFTQGMNK